MQPAARQPVQFVRPPVMEVACGIAFSLEKPLKSPHVGLYWSAISDEFVRCEDAAPIPGIVESIGGSEVSESGVQIEFVGLPPLRRSWLINAAGTHLIQLQEDRFLYNWKRTGDGLEYPSYGAVVAGFRAHWSRFKAFLVSQELGDPTPTQLELTYFNMLPATPGLLRDHVRAAGDRFLPEPEGVAWRSQYLLPEGAGRLHIAATSARVVSTGLIGIRLDITARGLPKESSSTACERWFDMAHEWITHGFVDVTTPEAHEIWGRTA